MRTLQQLLLFWCTIDVINLACCIRLVYSRNYRIIFYFGLIYHVIWKFLSFILKTFFLSLSRSGASQVNGSGLILVCKTVPSRIGICIEWLLYGNIKVPFSLIFLFLFFVLFEQKTAINPMLVSAKTKCTHLMLTQQSKKKNSEMNRFVTSTLDHFGLTCTTGK